MRGCPSSDLVLIYPSSPFRYSCQKNLGDVAPSSACTDFLRLWTRKPRSGCRLCTAPARLSWSFSSRARALTPWFALSLLPRSLRTADADASEFRRTFLTKSSPAMRNIKPVTPFCLASRIVQDCLQHSSSLFPFTPPRRRLSKPASSNQRCVAWNGQSALPSSGGMHSNPWSL